MKQLHLTLQKKWYDMILSGKKTEEYRQIKPYWFKRLVYNYKKAFKYLTGYDWDDGIYLEEGVYSICNEKSGSIAVHNFGNIVFRNGYSKSAPTITVKCEQVTIGIGKPEWGAPKEKVFIIKLGKIIE